ncbi:hypothetical protein LCGC14_0600960 [marine sediment metagenome]|uniref:Uncharacterized protein n=1 Tax=marine sediment metagenome TaxID=412755 RepID=A0A0F9RAQ1_9ZZZZ
MSVFVAVLEPNPNCKLGCNGSGKIRHYRKVDTQEHRKICICSCVFIQYESDDFEEVLKHMAKLSGRPVGRKSGIVTAEEARLGV